MIRRKILILRDISYVHLKNLALDTGVLDGHSAYTRYIILGRGRSGTNFLRTSLNSHSQIVAFGELFMGQNNINWGVRGYRKSKSMLTLIQNDPIKFLEKKVFRKYPKQTSAVGFKIFYDHAQDEDWKLIWTHLKKQKDLKVIHLRRKNILKIVLSTERVRQGSKAINMTGAQESKSPVVLDYDECLRAFKNIPNQKKEYDLLFKDHHKIDVVYEKLTKNYEEQMKRIQEFLGVDYEIVKPATYKQTRLPLSQAIANYSELKEKFTGTPWEEFFEE